MIKTRILDTIACIACTRYRLVLFVAVLLTVLSIIPPLSKGMRTAFDIGKMLPQEIEAAQHFTRAVIDFDSADEAVIVFHLDGRYENYQLVAPIADRIVNRLRSEDVIKHAFCKKIEDREIDYLMNEFLPEKGLLLLDGEQIEKIKKQLEPKRIEYSVTRRFDREQQKAKLIPDEKQKAKALRATELDILGIYKIFDQALTSKFKSDTKKEKNAYNFHGYLVDKNCRMLLIAVQPKLPAQSIKFSTRVMDLLRKTTEEELDRAPPGVKNIFSTANNSVEFAGGYEITCRYTERVTDALKWTLITSMIGVIVLFGYCFRRKGVLIYIGIPLIMIVSWTIGLGWLIFGQLNIVSCAFAAVLVGLGVDYAIHIYNRYVEERAQGVDVKTSFRTSLAHTGWGVFVGMATTAFAFLALKETRFTQLSEFGVLAGLGIALSVPGMLFVLPALISWRNNRREEHVRILRPTNFYLPTLAKFVESKRKLVFVLSIIVMFAFAAELVFGNNLSFDERMSSLRPQDRAFELTGEVARTFSTHNPNKLMLLSYGATEEEALERAATRVDGCRKMKDQGLLVAYESLHEYLPSPSEQRRTLVALKGVDFTAALNAFKEALDEAGLNPHRFKENIRLLERHAELVNSGKIILASDFENTPIEKLSSRFVTRRREKYDIRYDKIPSEKFPLTLATAVVTYDDEDNEIELFPEGAKITQADIDSLQGKTKRIKVLADGWTVKANIYPPVMEKGKTADLDINSVWIKKAEDYLDLKSVDEKGERTAFLTGSALLAHELAGVIKSDFWRVSTYVLLIATIVLAFFFHRHPVRIIYCLLPIGAGLLFLFGIMSLFKIQFNFINVLAIPIIIGLGVDNGIHLVARFYESHRRIQPMIADTGRAIMITSLTSIIGFGSLAVGGYQGITSMGVLSILALVSNLVSSLIVLPAFIRTFSPPETAPENYEEDQDTGWM